MTEIEGLGAIVRLMKYHSDIVLPDINELIHALNHECKNLRSQVNSQKKLKKYVKVTWFFSQVTRAAIQTFLIMFSVMGKDVEMAKSLESTIQLLLTKTADTNR